MTSTAMTAPRRVASKSSWPSWPGVHLIRQACDGFIELRQDAPGGRRPALAAAAAVIGPHRVFLLIHGSNGRTGRRGANEDRRRSMQSRKSQHVLRLAQRLRRPLIVCVVDPPGSPKAVSAAQKRPAASPLHLLSQWKLDVPIILVVSAAKVSLGVFAIWLADRCVSLAHSRFVSDRANRSEIDSGELVRCNILDSVVVASAGGTVVQAKTTSYKLRDALIGLLDDVADLTAADLRSMRKERLARVENFLILRA